MMKSWIRGKGLLAFLVFMGLITGFWFLLVDGIVERTIEKYGTKAIGAKVELDRADLSLFPAGLQLDGLQVTNPDNPMQNALEADRIRMSLDAGHLLRRKVIIDDMILAGIRLNTPRKRSGAVGPAGRKPYETEEKTVGKDKSGLPDLKIPTVSEILEKEELETLTLTRSLQQDIESSRSNWQKRLSELPDRDKFSQYQKKIKEATGGKKGAFSSFLSSAGDVSAIHQEIQKDLESLKTAQKDFKKEVASLKIRIDQLSKAPMKDIGRLKEKYALTPQGLSNFSRLLLGQKVYDWSQRAIAWYERIQPILDNRIKQKKGPKEVTPLRGKGINVLFEEKEPLPDFLIRLATANIQMELGDLTGKIQDITPDQSVLGRPLTFSFKGDKLKNLTSADIDGVMDHVASQKSMDRITAKIRGYELKNVVLSDRSDLPLVLTNALSDLNLETVLQGKNIAATIDAALTSTRLSSGGASNKEGALTRAIQSALAGISRFNVKADIKGTLDNYDIRLKSDMDDALKNAVGQVVKTESEKFEKQLKQGVLEKVTGPMNQTKSGLSGFDGIGSQLTDRLDTGNNLLSKSGLPF